MRFVLLLSLVSCAIAQAKKTCEGEFQDISAEEWVKKINPGTWDGMRQLGEALELKWLVGWNLGNTLDAVPDEGAWNNKPVVPETFDDIKKAGFKSVRLPVTWTTKIGPSPSYIVNATWLDRVDTVLEQITSRGLYAIVNVHHDSWEWFDFSAPGANVKELESKFGKLWFQIGTKLACASSLVAFESINEAKGTTQEHGNMMNRMNEVFLKSINEAGGFNAQRVVNLVGLGEDSIKSAQFFKKPGGTWTNPWALQFHYYSPCKRSCFGYDCAVAVVLTAIDDFIFSAWGKTIWGSAEDIATLDTDFRLLRQNFTDIPLVLGEYAASPETTEPAARWKWLDKVGI
jgi:endoglucanase